MEGIHHCPAGITVPRETMVIPAVKVKQDTPRGSVIQGAAGGFFQAARALRQPAALRRSMRAIFQLVIFRR